MLYAVIVNHEYASVSSKLRILMVNRGRTNVLARQELKKMPKYKVNVEKQITVRKTGNRPTCITKIDDCIKIAQHLQSQVLSQITDNSELKLNEKHVQLCLSFDLKTQVNKNLDQRLKEEPFCRSFCH